MERPVTTLPGEPGTFRRTQVISPRGEATAFWRARVRIIVTLLRQGLQTARLRVGVFLFVSLIFWGGLFWLFAQGFQFHESVLEHEGVRAQTVQAIYNVFFSALLAMLTFSSGLILYTSLYRSPEALFLLTTPASAGRILLHKLQESTVFSGWGLLLLGSPLLVAYGVTFESPWYYYVMLLPFMVAFVMIPSNIGAICCMLVVRLLPAGRTYAVVLIGVLVLGAFTGAGYAVFGGSEHQTMSPEWFQETLGRLRFTEQRMLPSWWLSSGLLEAAHPSHHPGEWPSWMESLAFFAVLLSTALFTQQLAQWTAHFTLRAGFSGMQGVTNSKRAVKISWIDRMAGSLMFPFSNVMRTMLVKDFRTFRRDPMQWAQFIIFFGLLVLYFLNIPQLQTGSSQSRWTIVIGFVNVAVVGLILSTFTTRFIYPLISLEGRRMWILGTLPIDRAAVVWGKFLLSCAASLPVCCGLIVLSDTMLQTASESWVLMLVHQLQCVALCVGLSALAVGLGSRYPNLREPSPSRIAAGFGGTLNLVVSSLFIMITSVFISVPGFFWLEESAASKLPTILRWIGVGGVYGVLTGATLTLVMTAIAITIPMRMGLHSFRRLEF